MSQTLAALLRQVFSLLRPEGGPSAADVRAVLEPGRKVTVAGPDLQTPPWALAVGSADDVFIELEADHEVEGVRVWNEKRWSATNLELSVRRATLADVEAVVGKTSVSPRTSSQFERAYVLSPIAGRNIAFSVLHNAGTVSAITFSLDVAPLPQPVVPRGQRVHARSSPIAELVIERFEVRQVGGGRAQVVRYDASGEAVGVKTITWDEQYTLRGATIRADGDGVVVELDTEHWKGGTPLEDGATFRIARAELLPVIKPNTGLVETLRALFSVLVKDKVVSAADLRAKVERPGRTATKVAAGESIRFEETSDVKLVFVWQEAGKPGVHARVAVRRGAIEDVEAVTSSTQERDGKRWTFDMIEGHGASTTVSLASDGTVETIELAFDAR